MTKRLTFQLFQQSLPQFFIAGLAQQGEHVLLIGLHAGLVKGIHVQQIAAQAAGILEEVDQLAQGMGVLAAGLDDDVGYAGRTSITSNDGSNKS